MSKNGKFIKRTVEDTLSSMDTVDSTTSRTHVPCQDNDGRSPFQFSRSAQSGHITRKLNSRTNHEPRQMTRVKQRADGIISTGERYDFALFRSSLFKMVQGRLRL